jgi:predicted MFS family arabinose efflux permease
MRTFRSLRHRNYRLYFLGQMVSLVGSWMQTTALMWLAYQLTRQSKWPAFLSAAMIGPTVLLGAWSGALADRCRRHALIVRTQIGFLLSASILTVVVSLGLANIGLLLALMFCHGIIQAIDLPARLAFVPDLVEREDLINVVALNSVQFNVARAIGPAIAGVLLIAAGPAVCFLVNALSYVAVLVALLLMRGFREHHEKTREQATESGLAVLRRKPRLLVLILLAGWVAVAGWPLLALLPAFAANVLHRSEGGYSALLSAVGVGALLAALTAATVGSERRQRRLLLLGLGCVCVALTGMTRADDLYLAAGCCGLFGYGMILFFATGQGAVQLGADDAHRGKVMGFWAMTLSGGAPLGNLVFGPAADAWGVTTVITAQAVMAALALAALFAARPLLRPKADGVAVAAPIN